MAKPGAVHSGRRDFKFSSSNMSNRVVYGNDHSENGWPMVDKGSCNWITVPGANPPVNLEIQQGWPTAILRAYVADHNAYVEPVLNDDSCCWTPTNSVASSNHLSGTAVDIRWNLHPFQQNYAGYSQDQIATVRELLDFYEGTIFWGEDWGLQNIGPFDCMHFQLNGDTFNNPHTGDFIARKIRADGFSTFRRDNVPVPPPPPPVLSSADGYAVKIIQEGQRLGITPRGIQIALSVALVETNLTMYANSNDPPSLDLPHDAVGSDHMSSGLFQQQTSWGSLADRMDATKSAAIFFTVDNGGGVRGLTKIRDDNGNLYDYNDTSNSPGFYAQTVQGSAFPDRYDARFNEAVDLYNRLATGAPPAPPPTQGDDMALVPQQEWAQLKMQMDRVFHEVADLRESRSPVREPDEGVKDTWSGFGLNTDGSVHLEVCKVLAGYGHPPTIAKLKRVAAMPVDKPGREGDCLIAQAILADVTSTPVAAAPVTPMAAPMAPAAPQVVYVDRPAPAPAALPAPVPDSAPTTTGQAIGALFDALESMRLADALPIEARAPLSALISVLQTKNGSQL